MALRQPHVWLAMTLTYTIARSDFDIFGRNVTEQVSPELIHVISRLIGVIQRHEYELRRGKTCKEINQRPTG